MTAVDDDDLPQARCMHGFTEEGLVYDALAASIMRPSDAAFLRDSELFEVICKADFKLSDLLSLSSIQCDIPASS